MTHQDFINKWNGKFQERRDPTNRNQCFDLVVGYIIDVYGLPEDTFSGLLYAYEIYTKPTNKTGTLFDFIVNQPYAIPHQGDIVVWSNKYGPAGHTAIVHTADVNSLTAFSQNDPTGSPCQLRKYNYMNILGFLRRVTGSVSQSEIDKLKTEFAVTEERLRKEKDQAVREGEEKLRKEKDKCFADMVKIQEELGRYKLVIENIKKLL